MKKLLQKQNKNMKQRILWMTKITYLII